MKTKFTTIVLILFIGLAKAQNVGIGTSTPTKKLDVFGDELVGYITPRYTGSISFLIPSTLVAVNYVQAWTSTQNEHMYVLFSTSSLITWLQAQELARIVKGHLLTITNDAENTYLKTSVLLHSNAQGRIPLGFVDVVQEGVWQCITGEIGAIGTNAQYTYWNVGEPNNGSGGTEDVATILESSTNAAREWNDVPITSVEYSSVIVEFEYILSP